MSIDRELQDKLWQGLSEETQAEYREKYKFHLDDSKRDPKDNFGGGYDLTVLRSETIVEELETMFGRHNLNPKPKIRTWEDVKKYRPEEEGFCCEIEKTIAKQFIDRTLYEKVMATIRLAKLMFMGYGGAVTAEEWEDANSVKHCVVRDRSQLRHCCLTTDYEFMAFHTAEQYEEFMSYESNRKLVERYYCL